MPVNKVIYYGETLVDMSTVSVRPETLLEGETALDASGELIEGTLVQAQLPELTNPGTAAHLLEGKQMIDADGNVITGTMPNVGAENITMDDVDDPTVSISAGCHDGNGKVTVRAEPVIVDPNDFMDERVAIELPPHEMVEDGANCYINKVTLLPVSDKYQDVSAVTATAEDVAAGKVFVDAEGNVVTGTAEAGGGSAGTVTCTITAAGPMGPAGTLHYVDGDGNYQTTTAKGSISVMKNTLVVAVSGGDGVRFSGDAASNNVGASAEIKVAYVTGDFTLKM